MANMNPQEMFWADEFAGNYRHSNSNFDRELNKEAWGQILKKVPLDTFDSFLECGSNIGRNISSLNAMYPLAKTNVIEINKEALNICISSNKVDKYFLGSIKEADFDSSFDVVFSSGVLIHIAPTDLLDTLTNMFRLSNRYVIVSEYFNRTPVSIEYHGEQERLFKRDWGKFIIENFPVRTLDYGFLWGQIYDSAGFDDMTYWVFEKINN